MEKLKIFIVDDDIDFAESLVEIFELKGHICQMAHDGEQAIKTLQAEHFDVTFMDVQLPGMNGVESFLEIKKTKPNAKVIMMTGYSVEQLLNQAVENGAWGILHKPYNVEHALKLLEKISPAGVLIADDDHDFVTSIQEVLCQAGHRVYRACNGQEALEKIHQTHIDVLILDLRMPILNGLETYLEVKKQGIAVSTIIVTAYPMDEIHAVDKLKSLSVTGILTKPVDPENLLKIIQELTDDKLKVSDDSK